MVDEPVLDEPELVWLSVWLALPELLGEEEDEGVLCATIHAVQHNNVNVSNMVLVMTNTPGILVLVTSGVQVKSLAGCSLPSGIRGGNHSAKLGWLPEWKGCRTSAGGLRYRSGAQRAYCGVWRKRVGVEPTGDGVTRRPPVLKTGTITGPHALPLRIGRSYKQKRGRGRPRHIHQATWAASLLAGMA